MSQGFYLNWIPSTPRSDRYRQWKEGIRTRKLNYIIEVPIFDIDGFPWVGASYIATEFWGTLPGIFSFRKPVINDPGSLNFFLCIRTPQRNSTGLDVTRYKLWTPAENVRLETFGVYNEQRLSGDFAIEVWTVPSSTRVNLSQVFDIISSLILDPSACCDHDYPIITLEEHCDIWALQNGNGKYTLPIQFDTCFKDIPGDTYYRVIETGEIRCNEVDDLRVYV